MRNPALAINAIDVKSRKLRTTRTPNTANVTPLVSVPCMTAVNAEGSCRSLPKAIAISMLLNRIALIAEAVASMAAIETATKPALPSTGTAACATAVSAYLARSASLTFPSTIRDIATYSSATKPIAP